MKIAETIAAKRLRIKRLPTLGKLQSMNYTKLVAAIRLCPESSCFYENERLIMRKFPKKWDAVQELTRVVLKVG